MDSSIPDLLADGGFQGGLVFGALTTVALVVRPRGGEPRDPSWMALGFAAAAVAALGLQSLASPNVVLGVAAVAVAGLLTSGRPAGMRLGAAVPGVLLLALSAEGGGDRTWVVPTLLVVGLGGGWLLGESDRALGPSGVVPLLVAGTVLGAWATTPETEHVAVLAGVGLPLVVLGWAGLRSRAGAGLGAAGAVLVAVVMSWAIVIDGAPRAGAVVGGLACWGVLVLEPLARHGYARLAGTTGTTSTPTWYLMALVGGHAALVVVCSRVAGLRTSAFAALAIVAMAYLAAAAIFFGLQRLRCHTP